MGAIVCGVGIIYAEVIAKGGFEVAICNLKNTVNRLRFAGRKLESDLSFRPFTGDHQFLDGVDQVLNGGVVSFEAAVQLVDFGGKLAVFDKHLAHAHEGSNHEDAHFDSPLRIEDGCGHDGAVLGEGVGRVAAAATAFL